MSASKLSEKEFKELRSHIEDIADICTDLGGTHDIVEGSDGISISCDLREKMNLEFEYKETPNDTVKSTFGISAGDYRNKPELHLLIGEASIDYDEDDREMVVENKEMRLSLSRYGRIDIIDTALDNYYRRLSQY